MDLPVLLRLFARRPAPATRTAPRQLPHGFKSMPLVRSWAVTGDRGDIIHHQVSRCSTTHLTIHASVPYAEGGPVTVKAIRRLPRWSKGF